MKCDSSKLEIPQLCEGKELMDMFTTIMHGRSIRELIISIELKRGESDIRRLINCND